ncbi:MAG: hypothetical protein V2A78_13200 [bacterium]
MKKLILALLVFLFCFSAAWADRPTEIKTLIDSSIKQVDKRSPKSFKNTYPNGKIKETFIKEKGDILYSLYDEKGKMKIHYAHKKGEIMTYESRYPSGKLAERCMVDSRFIQYTSFWENGHTKEHYLYILKDNSTEYFHCDSKGKIIP